MSSWSGWTFVFRIEEVEISCDFGFKIWCFEFRMLLGSGFRA